MFVCVDKNWVVPGRFFQSLPVPYLSVCVFVTECSSQTFADCGQGSRCGGSGEVPRPVCPSVVVLSIHLSQYSVIIRPIIRPLIRLNDDPWGGDGRGRTGRGGGQHGGDGRGGATGGEGPGGGGASTGGEGPTSALCTGFTLGGGVAGVA